MHLDIVDIDRCVGCQVCMFACTRRQNIAGLNRSCIHVRSLGGMERGFTVITCRACPDPPCAKACPEDALKVRPGGGVLLQPDKCTGCEACRSACIIGAVFWDEGRDKPNICIHCGFCAAHCPHGVLSLEKGKEAAHAAE